MSKRWWSNLLPLRHHSTVWDNVRLCKSEYGLFRGGHSSGSKQNPEAPEKWFRDLGYATAIISHHTLTMIRSSAVEYQHLSCVHTSKRLAKRKICMKCKELKYYILFRTRQYYGYPYPICKACTPGGYTVHDGTILTHSKLDAIASCSQPLALD